MPIDKTQINTCPDLPGPIVRVYQLHDKRKPKDDAMRKYKAFGPLPEYWVSELDDDKCKEIFQASKVRNFYSNLLFDTTSV